MGHDAAGQPMSRIQGHAKASSSGGYSGAIADAMTGTAAAATAYRSIASRLTDASAYLSWDRTI
jgi:hypothetical protein